MRLHKWHMLIWGSLFLLMVGFVLHVYQLFYMAAAWGLLAPLSYLLARLNLHKLEVSRSAPSHAVAGEPTTVNLTVHNRAPRRRFLFTVEDLLPEGLQAAPEARQVVIDLPPYARRTFPYQLLPQRRGVYQLADLRLTAPDLLGIYEFSRRIPQSDELIVYPRPIALPHLWTATPSAAASRSPRRRRTNEGLDICGVREYVPGDDLRRIHWKASAHASKLIVTEREERYGLAGTVLLDLSRGAHTGTGDQGTLEYAVTLAASLLVQLLNQRGAAQLIARGARDHSVLGAGPGREEMAILEALARVQADSDQALAEVVNHHRQHLSAAGAVAVITPQIGEEMLALVGALRSWGNAVSYFSLLAPSFAPPAASDRSEGQYRRFAAALRRGGCRAHLIRGDASLAAASRGWQRVAG